jgi:fumarate hydratase subunit beta
MEKLRTVQLPMTQDVARDLKLGEGIYLDGQIVATAGIPTHARILDFIERGEDLPVDLNRAAFFHLGSLSQELENGDLDVLYMNPTTSTRFNPVMPTLIKSLNLSCVGGKGGLDHNSAEALQVAGGVYLSFLGGGCPLISDSIKRVVEVAWQDMISHYRLVVLEVEQIGPLTVAIDAHGNSLYDQLSEGALEKRDDILAQLAVARPE